MAKYKATYSKGFAEDIRRIFGRKDVDTIPDDEVSEEYIIKARKLIAKEKAETYKPEIHDDMDPADILIDGVVPSWAFDETYLAKMLKLEDEPPKTFDNADDMFDDILGADWRDQWTPEEWAESERISKLEAAEEERQWKIVVAFNISLEDGEYTGSEGIAKVYEDLTPEQEESDEYIESKTHEFKVLDWTIQVTNELIKEEKEYPVMWWKGSFTCEGGSYSELFRKEKVVILKCKNDEFKIDGDVNTLRVERQKDGTLLIAFDGWHSVQANTKYYEDNFYDEFEQKDYSIPANE